MARVKAAIIGSGNIGADLMMKMIKYPQNMELAIVVGIDERSEGHATARERRSRHYARGPGETAQAFALQGYRHRLQCNQRPCSQGSRRGPARRRHPGGGPDPAAIGPFIVSPVDMEANLAAANVELGPRKRVGDQEDMIVNVALDMLKDREQRAG